MTMIIGLDFDWVITDCGRLKSESAKKLYGIDVPPGKFKKEYLLRKGIFTLESYLEFGETIYGTREYSLSMEPVDGALYYLPKIIANGHQVQVITSRNATQLKVAKEWALLRGLWLDFVGVGYGASKAEAAVAAGIELYVDDDSAKLAKLVDVVKHLFLFHWEYNESDPVDFARRVYSWEELYGHIQRVEGK